MPGSANEVSEIITTLLQNNEKFTVKSGGHNPNPTYSSVAGGPLINLKGLTEATYQPQSSTVRIGAGNGWSAVIKALQPYNVSVVGGRIGHVGVGGYLVGGECIASIQIRTQVNDQAGGLRYLRTQYGWAADNIAAAEVVLANGTIVTASSTSNVGLFNVLTG